VLIKTIVSQKVHICLWVVLLFIREDKNLAAYAICAIRTTKLPRRDIFSSLQWSVLM
jgi:hypothetical protein